MTTYAFTFDARACSGCKACQEACKDKNGLPLGVLWRRVIEVTGGGWLQKGEAWENSVFAYNLSLACSHCVHPKCAGVCPTEAYTVRPDGIVLLDSSRCMGCGYCAWACPYGAPQYDSNQGIMGKCNFCYDSLEAGQPPACVAACPMRVLNYGALENMDPSEAGQALWALPAAEHPFPLPVDSHTQPHLAIQIHSGMRNPLEKTVANREEIRPPLGLGKLHRIPASEELPLVAFTLLTQMSVGLAVCGLGITPLPVPVLLAIGGLLGAGGLSAFLHLGRKRNSWRAVTHLKKSWLSREVLLAGLFGACWALTVGSVTAPYWVETFLGGGQTHGFSLTAFTPWLMALMGSRLIYSMARVYRLHTVPAWDSWRTPAGFFLSAAVLGSLGINLFHPEPIWAVVGGLALSGELGLALTDRSGMAGKANRLRVVLLGLGILGALLAIAVFQDSGPVLAWPVFLIALLGEIIGRWQFYASRSPYHF